MSNIIVIGCGRVGSQLAESLSLAGHNVSVIDKDRKAFEFLGSDFSGVTLCGIGFDVDTLEKAGSDDADILIACTSSDNVNLMACEVAKRLCGIPRVIARLYNPTRLEVYEELGIEYIVGTALIAKALVRRVEKKPEDKKPTEEAPVATPAENGGNK